MKELKIECPEGYVIDKDNSDLLGGVVKFKKVKECLTYQDVAKELFKVGESKYTISSNGEVFSVHIYDEAIQDPNDSTTEAQLKGILALNKLANVAKYLNGDWKPDWDAKLKAKYTIIYSHDGHCLYVTSNYEQQVSGIYFKSKELAEKAIEILGEEEIMKIFKMQG